MQGDAEQLSVDITSRSGDCDDVEYTEAVGFDLAGEFEQAEVTATHSG